MVFGSFSFVREKNSKSYCKHLEKRLTNKVADAFLKSGQRKFSMIMPRSLTIVLFYLEYFLREFFSYYCSQIPGSMYCHLIIFGKCSAETVLMMNCLKYY